MSNPVGIYNVYGIKEKSQIIIQQKEVVYPKENEEINDIPVSNYKIIENVSGKICACNITDRFLLSTKKLPLFYISVVYEVPLKTVLLYRLYFSFTITDNTTCKEELIESPINGKFYIELFINNTQNVIDDKIENFVGNEETYEKLKKFTLAGEMKTMTEAMVDEIIQQLKEQYDNQMDDFNIPENIINLKNYDLDKK